jgi:hypothetical protein
MNKKLENCKIRLSEMKDNVFVKHIEEIEKISNEKGVDIGVACDMWRNGKELGDKEEVYKQLNNFLDLFPEFTFAHVKEAKAE